MTEEWRPVLGFEDQYEVSNLGQVRSLPRIDSAGRRRKSYLLRQSKTAKGYLVVDLTKESKGYLRTVHRLMVLAFLGPCPASYVVDHIDGNKLHNVIGNLEYVTPDESLKRASILGLLRPVKGEQNGKAKLTQEQVNEIRQLEKQGMSQRKIAKRFNVGQSQIWRIVRNKHWK